MFFFIIITHSKKAHLIIALDKTLTCADQQLGSLEHQEFTLFPWYGMEDHSRNNFSLFFFFLCQLPIWPLIVWTTTCQFNKARHDDQPDNDPRKSMGCALFDILVNDFQLYRSLFNIGLMN